MESLQSYGQCFCPLSSRIGGAAGIRGASKYQPDLLEQLLPGLTTGIRSLSRNSFVVCDDLPAPGAQSVFRGETRAPDPARHRSPALRGDSTVGRRGVMAAALPFRARPLGGYVAVARHRIGD